MFNIPTIILFISTLCVQKGPMKQLEKNGMTVQWEVKDNRIHFYITAPTRGWATIGFNERDEITGAYLLMGRVQNGHPEVVEHFTSSPGNYQPIANLGIPSQTQHVTGRETSNRTEIAFSIPLGAASHYHKDIAVRSSWTLIMAYSQEDDFEHHSRMRTSLKITI